MKNKWWKYVLSIIDERGMPLEEHDNTQSMRFGTNPGYVHVFCFGDSFCKRIYRSNDSVV